MSDTATKSPSRFSTLYSRKAQGVPDAPRMTAGKGPAPKISFIYGFPDPGSLPGTQVAEATARAMEHNAEKALQYGGVQGVPVLIETLLAKLKADQGIEAGPENVIVTSGASQAVELLFDAVIDPGDIVLAEQPTWSGFNSGLTNMGGKVAPITVDEHGSDVDGLAASLESYRAAGTPVKFIYVIPNFQNPTGVTMALERRKRLVELAQEYDTIILEDDAYFDLRYEGEFLPTIYSLDPNGRTIYLGTLSKIMGAGMRLGWAVGPAELITKMTVLKMEGGSGIFASYVAAEWMPEHLTTHIEGLREIYKRRRDIMLDALEKHMPEGTTWTKPEGGFFVWVTLPEGIDTVETAPMARERGVDYLPGQACFANPADRNTFRLSFSFASDEQIPEGVEILGDIFKAELKEQGR
ncbi:MAG TPA: PLP-dependent aminotransferase family protein [Thermomicrobiales bacterium]|jgi:2-aminoadipate transaminase|nr:PLP-dependent aminotransferase family protein [Thermomicrobiales bacterium]